MNKTIKIVLIVAVVAVVVYFLFFKKKSTGTTGNAAADSLASSSKYTDDDKKAFNETIAYFKANVNGADGALSWLLPLVKEALDGKRSVDAFYLINGQVTLTGALMATFDGAFGSNNKDVKIDSDVMYRGMFSAFVVLKEKATQAAILS